MSFLGLAVVDLANLNAMWSGDRRAVLAASSFLTPEEAAAPYLPALPAWREYYEERAAIREFDGGQPRPVAQFWAMLEAMWRFPG